MIQLRSCMSYDLFFQRQNGAGLTRGEFSDYFGARPHYKVEANGQALYENEDTGVYFIMEHNEVEGIVKTEDLSEYSPANLSLNYLRPHIFTLEAEPEIAAFVKAFDLSITDLQNSGNPSNVYDKEAFVRGWNHGNKFAFDSLSKTNPEIRTTMLPGADIEKHWRWNFGRTALQAKLGTGIFVPKITYHMQAGEVRSLIVWSEAIPTAFPEVDTIIVFRQFASRSSLSKEKRNDLIIVDFSEIAPLLGNSIEYANGNYQTLRSENEACEWVAALPESDAMPVLVSVDRVLDQDLAA